MQRVLNQALFVLMLAGGFCVAAPVDAQAQGDPGRDDGFVTVPIKIHWGEGVFVVVPFDDPLVPDDVDTENCPTGEGGFPNGGGIVISSGDGEGRHLGRIANFSTRCAAQFFPPTDPPAVNFDVRTTETAANGDQLFGRMEFAPTPYTPQDVDLPMVRITGGTGRFEGASGWLTPSQNLETTCTDDSGFCLEGTWSGGYVEGQLTLPRP
ncbi:MAG: hypothetical protein ACNS61_12565 [Candidatus Wenzhouxiangella sp. M2_3B_020]